MSALGLALLCALALEAGAPRPLCLLLALPALLLAPGLGWARWLLRVQQELAEHGRTTAEPERPAPTGLQLAIDASWISLAAVWIGVALLRESRPLLPAPLAASPALLLLAGMALFGMLGELAGRGRRAASSSGRELLAAALIGLSLLGTAAHRQADLARPLDAHWWLPAADERLGDGLAVVLAGAVARGAPESPAWRLDLPGGRARIEAQAAAEGEVLLVLRGPIGARLEAGGGEVTIARDVLEEGEEEPVRRYRERGAAAMLLPVALGPGESLEVEVVAPSPADRAAPRASEAMTLYLLPGVEALWALHGAGELRFTHYWQILNQVENLDWAAELLQWRRLTLNQPPGWSPILSLVHLYGDGDLPGTGLLFLWVLGLCGLSAVRLLFVLAPACSPPALALPALGVAVLGLLMIEPGSTMFPDPLYTAALLGAALALAARRPGWFAFLGLGAGLLRYPGLVVAGLLGLAAGLSGSHPRPGRALGLLGVFALSAALGGLLLMWLGHAEDLLFILYFETLPEHWHDDYRLSSLLPRVPAFYTILLRYSGGALLLGPLLALGPTDPGRRGARFLLGGALAYSLALCTIDHHPTHYFLPLVMFCVLSVGVLSQGGGPVRRWLAPGLVLLGLWTTLRIGQVF